MGRGCCRVVCSDAARHVRTDGVGPRDSWRGLQVSQMQFWRNWFLFCAVAHSVLQINHNLVRKWFIEDEPRTFGRITSPGMLTSRTIMCVGDNPFVWPAVFSTPFMHKAPGDGVHEPIFFIDGCCTGLRLLTLFAGRKAEVEPRQASRAVADRSSAPK